ncbi:MAG TPA: NADPH-dependent 7-cyano-7-deazaguanine reductase QueF [Lentisphaeria bacterium]|nr:MAG: 7-cyano-7-deazaguanine reductase [Lentisphaerae bacterium GWF2_49_21]HBC86763.1 NADPH-dependent 7-cyano-7-deazaguanine reductase QueF [Lentisphaeria bacterium]
MKKLDSRRFARLTQLKASRTSFPGNPQNANVEVFENLFPERNYEIEFVCPEFTSLCPVTGQPDFGEISVKYIPDRLCVESKSLKLFLFSFRNFNTFHEEAVNIIADRINEACSPRWLQVSGRFHPRGGISINVKVEKTRKGFRHK